jgi:hypothetical protein
MAFDLNDPLGTDLSGVDDVDSNLTPVSGRLMLLQHTARMWLLEPGELFYAPDRGAGLRRALNAATDDVGTLAARLEAEAVKDERVLSCKVDVTVLGEAIDIAGQLTDEQGPFGFTFQLTPTTTVLELTG